MIEISKLEDGGVEIRVRECSETLEVRTEDAVISIEGSFDAVCHAHHNQSADLIEIEGIEIESVRATNCGYALEGEAQHENAEIDIEILTEASVEAIRGHVLALADDEWVREACIVSWDLMRCEEIQRNTEYERDKF